MHTRMCTHTNTHMHTDAHTQIQTQTQKRKMQNANSLAVVQWSPYREDVCALMRIVQVNYTLEPSWLYNNIII